MTYPDMPAVPYGAVYFRKSNPPREDWERDYATAAEDGINVFRHWFMWAAIETRPGVYDWDDYDRHLDLGHKFKIKTIIAEITKNAPEWLFHERPEGRYRHADGRWYGPVINGASAVSGWYGMSMDDPVVRERATAFLTALVERYRDHPSLGGYDIWNECNYLDDAAYTPATIDEFRLWLKKKYGDDLVTLERAWRRYSMASWDNVLPPAKIESYPDSFDWLHFQQDNGYRHMRWRVELVRKLDPKHLITAHGVGGSFIAAATRGADDWKAANEVDLYGITWVESRQGDKPYQHIHAMDLTRAASRGKPFWHAESQAGPLWLQPQVVGRPLTDGRVTSPTDIRVWNLTSLAGGAKGIMCLRWRPLLDGPLFGAFGSYGMDGSRTDRSRMASSLAKWLNTPDGAALSKLDVVKGEVGIVYAPETQFQELALTGSVERYTHAIRGAYQGFFDNNIQADFVHIDHIDDYGLLYLPYPIMLNEASARRLAKWVEAGGRLISEAMPAYFGEHGHVGPTQPNFGLDRIFGARQTDVVIAPDIFKDITFNARGFTLEGGGMRQAYEATDGAVVGHHPDGSVAAVENNAGSGQTLLLGTMPSLGYYNHHSEGARLFFKSLLAWAGKKQHVTTSNRQLFTRLHEGKEGAALWVINPTTQTQRATLQLAAHGAGTPQAVWGDAANVAGNGAALEVTVPARDGLAIRLK